MKLPPYTAIVIVGAFSINLSYAATVSWDLDAGFSSLTSSVSLGEWNTDGDFESWTPGNVTNAAVIGGSLTGLAGSPPTNLAAVDPTLSIVASSLGLDLTTGDHDIVEFRLKLGDGVTVVNNARIDLFWGTSVNPGIAGARRVTIDTTTLPSWDDTGLGNGDEGNFRTYQIDMSGTAGWGGTLERFRFDPIAGTVAGGQGNQPFEVDYFRISNGVQIPEPGSALLGGLSGLLLLRRRR